jgi:hypothetical protein
MWGRAVLWRKRHKGRKVARRAAWAALCGVVVGFCIMPNGSLASATYKNHKTEIGVVIDSENVLIGGLPPKMEAFVSCVDFPQFGESCLPPQNTGMKSLLPRTNCCYALAADNRAYGIGKVGRNIGGDYINHRDYANVAGWRIAIIPEDRPKFELKSASLFEAGSALHGNIGSQLHRSRFAQMLELPLSSAPKLIGASQSPIVEMPNTMVKAATTALSLSSRLIHSNPL